MIKYSFIYFFLSIIIVGLLIGCTDQDESAYDQKVRLESELIESYLADNGVQAERLRSGIYVEVLKSNQTGKAIEDESILAAHYYLSTLDGKFIDSLSTTSSPIRFFHAQKNPNALFPQGINFGVTHMREGERYRFYLPSYQAFGSYSFGQLLPRESILIAEIEIQKIESEEAITEANYQAIDDYILEKKLSGVQKLSSGILFQSLEEGAGDLPKTGNLVKVDYKGHYLDDQVFDESEKNKPLEFFVGKSSIIPGFEHGVAMMKKGGKARILIPSNLGFGEGIQVIPSAIRQDFLKEYNIRDLRPYEPVAFEIELIDIQ